MDKQTVGLNSEDGQQIITEAIKRAHHNKGFTEKLKADPREVLRKLADEMDFDLHLPAHLEVVVVQDSPHKRYVVLPADGDLSDTPGHAAANKLSSKLPS